MEMDVVAIETKAWTWRWTALRNELMQRAKEPLEHPTFVIFFFTTVCGIGGVGTWFELFKLFRQHGAPNALDGLITSLITFFFAVVATSCTQFIIEESESKALRALAMFVLFLAIGAVLANTVVDSSLAGVLIWAFASVVALAVWWMTNAKSPGLKDPDAPTGGLVTKPLLGNLAGYKTE